MMTLSIQLGFCEITTGLTSGGIIPASIFQQFSNFKTFQVSLSFFWTLSENSFSFDFGKCLQSIKKMSMRSLFSPSDMTWTFCDHLRLCTNQGRIRQCPPCLHHRQCLHRPHLNKRLRRLQTLISYCNINNQQKVWRVTRDKQTHYFFDFLEDLFDAWSLLLASSACLSVNERIRSSILSIFADYVQCEKRERERKKKWALVWKACLVFFSYNSSSPRPKRAIHELEEFRWVVIVAHIIKIQRGRMRYVIRKTLSLFLLFILWDYV